MKLFYHKENNNYGDKLGPYIIKKLLGIDPEWTVNKEADLFTVGSIIRMVCYEEQHVWGAGLISRNDDMVAANYHLVRGKITKELLAINGKIDYGNTPMGDPALILPYLYFPRVDQPASVIGIMPHYVDYEEFLENEDHPNALIINPFDSVERVIDNILKCKVLISSSLHGLITAAAYRIPFIWIDTIYNKLDGDGIKFLDFASLFLVNPYDEFTMYSYNTIRSSCLNRNNFEYYSHNPKIAINSKLIGGIFSSFSKMIYEINKK